MSGPDPALTTFASSAEFDWSHPEADPSHPRYEPPHLRHQPGDTWQIGGRPFDPDDSGPYGNPLWRPDRRTGRHRRGELPDPLPPEPESSPPQVARPSPGPHRRGFWNEPAPERRHLRAETDQDQEEPHRFDRLREDAWDHFMTDSAPLAAAHTQPSRPRRQTAIEREAGLAWALWIVLAKWLLALIRSTSYDRGQNRFAHGPQHPETSSPAAPRPHKRPQVVEKAAEPLVPHARGGTRPQPVTMARAVAGAQRARAGCPHGHRQKSTTPRPHLLRPRARADSAAGQIDRRTGA
ncbi:hypothetical protein GCM10029992_12800 [Glycomyces albus]